MIDPDDYWVNKSMDPMFKAMMYDMEIWNAEQNGQDRAIDILNEATGHNGKTHHLGSKCWFCDAVALIKGENKPFITAKQTEKLTDEMLEE